MDKDNFSESSSDPESDSANEDEEEEEIEDIESEVNIEREAVVKEKVKQTKEIIIKKAVKETSRKDVASESKSVRKVDVKIKAESNVTQPNTIKKRAPGRSSILTGRGVTTHMLIQEQILEAGEKFLTIDYLGRKFIGDLNPDGTIKCHNVNKVFSSPSSWAMNCKKQINPDKKSGCGWASVRYKGRKLDEFKSAWFRKQKMSQVLASSAQQDQFKLENNKTHMMKSPTLNGSFVKDELMDTSYGGMMSPASINHSMFGSKSSPAIFHAPHQKALRKRSNRAKVSVKHSSIQPDSDPKTLVECNQFHTTGRIQPFSITISTSASLLIDFHCHLTISEVSGYLVGKWDIGRQHLRVLQACPCKYPQNASPEEIEIVEKDIQRYMEAKDLLLLGWYHSHPYCQPDPTIHDICSQLEYQKLLKDGHYEPCVGLIVSPYDSYKKESQFNAFWVRPPVEKETIGLPLSVRFTTFQDQILTQDLVNSMVSLVNFYRHFNDAVKFNDIWMDDVSYLAKLKHSIIRKCPQNQNDGRFLDFIHKMLMACCS